jgi:hypothetical protein
MHVLMAEAKWQESKARTWQKITVTEPIISESIVTAHCSKPEISIKRRTPAEL